MQKKGYVLTYFLLNSNKVLNSSFSIRLFYTYISMSALGVVGWRILNMDRKLCLNQ